MGFVKRAHPSIPISGTTANALSITNGHHRLWHQRSNPSRQAPSRFENRNRSGLASQDGIVQSTSRRGPIARPISLNKHKPPILWRQTLRPSLVRLAVRLLNSSYPAHAHKKHFPTEREARTVLLSIRGVRMVRPEALACLGSPT